MGVVCGGTDGSMALGSVNGGTLPSSTVEPPGGTAQELASTALPAHSPSGAAIEVIALDNMEWWVSAMGLGEGLRVCWGPPQELCVYEIPPMVISCLYEIPQGS